MEEMMKNETIAPVKEKKLSYEELEELVKNLYNKYSNAIAEIQNLRIDNAFKRLDYLFKVLEHCNLLDPDFVHQCAAEIQQVMTIVEDTETKDNE